MTDEELRDLRLYKFGKELIESDKLEQVLTPGRIRKIVASMIGNPLLNKDEHKYQSGIERLLVDDYQYDILKNSIKVDEGTSLTNPDRHVPWDFPSSWYYWEKHREFIISHYKKKDPENWKEIVKSLDTESDEILLSLENPIRENFNSHGLVIGYVQSGKTANFTALIAKAMDCGYQLIIVLAGMHNTLRVQTQSRLDRELLGYDDLNTEKPNVSSYIDKSRRPRRATKTQYTDSFDEKVADGEFNIRVDKLDDLLHLNEKYNKVIAIVKKNVSVLKKLNKWIDAYPAEKRREIPLLMIDDEADQASVDAKYVINKRKNKNLQENAAKTNKEITKLLKKFNRSAYIGYTATPFANCFIDPTYKNLYPKNLIHFLPKPETYFGAEEIFDSDKLKDAYVITKEVESKTAFFNMLTMDQLPVSLEGALHTFFIALAIRILRGESQEPMSMLVHITHKMAGISAVYNAISERKKAISRSLGKKTAPARRTKAEMKAQWEAMKCSGELITKETNTGNRDYFSFEKVYKTICEEIDSIELKQVHSDSDDELDYIKNPSLRVIAVGGNKLSRGLTLEGLLTTYFLRSTNNADTLMQMGRFFGYRRDYHDLMRVYCNERIATDFEYLIALESDLRSEVTRYKDEGLTPLDFAPAVRVHTRMRPSGKMGNARRFRKNLGASVIQTKYFKLKDKAFLQENNKVVDALINALAANGKPKKPKNSKSPGKVFYNVGIDQLNVFLEAYALASDDFNASDVIDYIERRDFRRFNVGIADLKTGTKTKFGKAGNFALVERSRKTADLSNESFNIGVLTEQRHLTMDLEDSGDDPVAKRKIPLLVLYRIDAGSKASGKKGREDLFKDIPEKVDISSYGIVMPGARGEEKDVWGLDI